jgi:hypothetical protein
VSEDPGWWTKALELERQDRLKEAEELLWASVDPPGTCVQIAELYAARMRRFLREGPSSHSRAVEAFHQSVGWMISHASGSDQAQVHRERLVKELGFDPVPSRPGSR